MAAVAASLCEAPALELHFACDRPQVDGYNAATFSASPPTKHSKKARKNAAEFRVVSFV